MADEQRKPDQERQARETSLCKHFTQRAPHGCGGGNNQYGYTFCYGGYDLWTTKALENVDAASPPPRP